MADRIKGITIEIGGDTTGLSKALSGVNKAINSTQTQLKDVEKLLKLDPTNTELLQQKQRLLAQAVSETSSKLSTLKEAEAQAQQQFKEGKISQEQYEALQREIVATSQQLDSLKDAASKSNAKLAEIAATADKVASKAQAVADATKGLSAAAAGGVAGLGAMAVKAGVAADDLNTLAKQSGFSTEELQKWKYASDLVDVSVDDIVNSAKKMKKNMVSTSKDVAGAWETLGVSVRDENGELRDANDVFYETLNALSRVENETERDTLAMQLFGKSADSLAGIVDDGGAALKELGDQAENAGLILSQDALDAANRFNDSLDTMKAKASAAFMSAGAELADTLIPLIEEVAEKVSGVIEWLAQLDGQQLKMIGTVLLVVAAISPLASLIAKISTLISFVSTTVIPALSAAMSFLAANPIVLVIAGIAALIAIINNLWQNNEQFRAAVTEIWTNIQLVFQTFQEWLDGVFAIDWTERFGAFGNILNAFFQNVQNVWNSIREIFNGIITFLKGVFTLDWQLAWQGVQDIFKGIFDALVEIAKAPINGIIGLINVAIDAINVFIDGVNKAIAVINALGGRMSYIPNIGKIAYLAKGGILSAGSAIVGEKGPELLSMIGGKAQVTPLSGDSMNRVAGGGEYNQTINIYGNQAPKPSEVARQTRLATRQLVKAVTG